MANKEDTFVMQDALERYAELDTQRLLGYDEGEGDEKTHVNGVKDDLESEIATAENTLNAAITQALADAKTYANGVDLNIEEEASTYVYTFTFTKADGTVYTKEIDLPIEEFVLSASYSDGVLTISLKNGESVDVDISALISGLVNQTDFDTLTGEFNSLCEVVEGDTTKGTTGLVGDVEQLQKDVAGYDTTDEDGNEIHVNGIAENTTAIEELQTDLANYEAKADLEGDVDEILAGKDYATKDDLETVEGTATEALQKANDLEETANIGMRLCFNSEGYPCVEYLISEV